MKKNQRPNKKIILSPDMFNSMYSTLLFFISTKTTAGETWFSQTAEKLKTQIDKYGIFKESENEQNNLFIIYYFDKEVIQIMKLMIMYNRLGENPTADYFKQFCKIRKA
jgi:hypothetical protein